MMDIRVAALASLVLIAVGCESKPVEPIVAKSAAAPIPKTEAKPTVYDWSNLRLVRLLTGPSGPITWMAFSEDGRTVAATSGRERINPRPGGGQDEPSYSGQIKVWNVDDGRILTSIDSQECSFERLAFSPDGSSMVAAGAGHGSVWSTKSWSRRFGVSTSGYVDLVFTRDGSTLIQYDELWDASSGEMRANSPEASGTYKAFNPKGDIFLCDTRTLRYPGFEVIGNSDLMSKARQFTSDGTKLLAIDGLGNVRGKLRCFDVSDAAHMVVLSEIDRPNAGTMWLSISSDDKAVIISELVMVESKPGRNTFQTPEGTFRYERSGTSIWSIPSLQLIREFERPPVVVKAAFQPKGRMLAIAAVDGQISLWEAAIRN
jgi:WD40 repeat protein